MIVDLHPIVRKSVAEISFGIHNFFKQQLGKDFIPGGAFDIEEDVHVCQVSHLSWSVAYAVWFVVAKLASRAGLDLKGSISSFLRYTLFLDDADKYANLIPYPYYVPYEEVTLSPLHQNSWTQYSSLGSRKHFCSHSKSRKWCKLITTLYVAQKKFGQLMRSRLKVGNILIVTTCHHAQVRY